MFKKLLVAAFIAIISTAAVGKEMVIYDFPITRVIDGDTVAFRATFLPAPLKQELGLRVFGVDTPEKGFRAKCPREAQLGLDASEFTKSAVYKAKSTRIAISGWDKYGGRVLGDVILDGKSLRELLISKGFAREYFGDAKKSWC